MRLSANGRSPSLGAVSWSEVGTLAGLAALIWFLWSSPIVFPLKILVVVFHELSHALAALSSGGSIERIEVVAREGGLCVTAGGNRFLVLTAGYLGSLVWGGVLLVAAARSRHDRALTSALGAILALTALLWVRPFLSFGFSFTAATAIALLAAGAYLPERGCELLLKTVGLVSVLYAILDIRDDILARPHLLESDAAVLGELTGLPTLFWGLTWIAVALVAAFFILKAACRRSEPPSQGRATSLGS